jgi:SDR family mycofactocin-dependent oxidoreductase
MSNTQDTNRQSADNINTKGSTNPIKRREMILGGATALAGVATAGCASLAQTSMQPQQEKELNERTATGKLKGKVVVITGAARGIGRATALTLAREGADIVAVDIARDISTVTYPLATPKDLAETERLVKTLGRRCISIQADVRNMARMRHVVERGITELGKIDILVANAGVLSASPLETMTDEQWQDNIDVDLTGAANSMRAVIPHMVSRKSGRIVAISSDIGRRGGAGVAHYCAAKWGVIGLVKSAALELAKNNITVNAISPGLTRTGMSQNPSTYRLFRPDLPNPTVEDVRTAVFKMNVENGELPIPWLEPEDIANGVLYLVCEDGRYVTGTALDITGGKSANYTA